MVAELDVSRRENAEMARMAGMSQIASGILHNIGTMLNSVNVSADQIQRKVRHLPLQDLERLIAELECDGELRGLLLSHAQGKHLPPLLTGIHGAIQDQGDAAAEEIHELRLHLEDMMTLVASQSEYASRASAKEWVDLSQVCDDALELTFKSQLEDFDVRVVREYAVSGPLYLDRHRLVEILVNLIQNALEALKTSDADPKELIVKTIVSEEDGVTVHVRDNGIGILEEDCVRIFQAGVSITGDGGGFGLHMAATTAMEMGGSLSAASDGLGGGATFTLRLPEAARMCSLQAA